MKLKERIDINNIPTMYIILFLFIASFAVRALYINAGLFHMDSVGIAQTIEKTYQTQRLCDPGYSRYGSVIFNFIVYAPYRFLTGDASSEKAILWTDLTFASFSVIVLFMVVLVMFNDKTAALFSSALFSLSPIFLSVTTYGKQHGICTFFILLSFLLLQYFQRRQLKMLLLLSSVSFAAAVLVREDSLIYLPLYLLLYLKPIFYANKAISLTKESPARRETFGVKNILYILLPLIVILGLHLYCGSYKTIANILFSKRMEYNPMAGFSFPFLMTAAGHLYFDLGPLGALLTALGFFVIFKIEKERFYLFFLLLMFLSFIIFTDSTVYKARLITISSVSLFIATGLGLTYIYRKSRIIALTLFIFLTTELFLRIGPILSFRHIYCGPKEYALWLKTQIPQNGIVIVVDDAPFVEYYSKLKPLKHPINDRDATKRWVIDIRQYIKDGIPVYITETGFSYDEFGIVKEALVENFNLQLIDEHANEHYQWTEIESAPYMNRLWRLKLKKDV